MTTESVKLDRGIVSRLRKFSHATGLPISRVANRLLNHSMNDPNWIDIVAKPPGLAWRDLGKGE